MTPTPLRASFVGAGRVGRTLAHLFRARGLVDVVDVAARSRASAEAGCADIGAGRAVDDLRDLDPVDVTFVLTADAAIADVAHELASHQADGPPRTFVHASGAHSSELLAPLRARGHSVASVHPIRSFAAFMPGDDVLDGVVCGAEGGAEALAVVTPIFESAGARIVTIAAEDKRLYHAAAVMACNHLVGLLESSLATYAAAGVPRDLALEALEPLVRGTVDNVFARGPGQALSGPVVRGEAELVAAQLEALGRVSPRLRDIYRDLAAQTLPLARDEGSAETGRLDALARVLDEDGEA